MKKLTTKLLISVLSIALALITLGTQTFAWFTMNRTVTASNMKVQAQAEGSIVIRNNADLPAADLKTTDVSFASDTSNNTLYASTHDDTYGEFTTGLKTVTNADEVNLETGLKRRENALTYADAINNNNSNGKYYYKDFTVYIAGDGDSFTGQDIVVTLTGTFATAANYINNAISVDFYGADVTTASASAFGSGNYKGTLNLAGYRNTVNNTTYDREEYTSFEIENVNIPEADGTAAYAITMRVYFDGALLESVGTAQSDQTQFVAATGTAAAGHYYYNDANGTSVVTVATGDSVTGLYEVNTTTTSKAYARNTESTKLQEVTLQAKFQAKTHD